MAWKDWRSVKFGKLSEINLLTYGYYGLLIDDTKVLLSIGSPPSLQIYDVADSIARCVHNDTCSTTPFGLCHSFESHVDHYQIEISDSVTHMKAISRGSTLILSGSDSEKIICVPGFSVKHTSKSQKPGNEPFISASFIPTITT